MRYSVGDLIKVESVKGCLRPPWYGMMGIIIAVESPGPKDGHGGPVYEVVVMDGRCPMKHKPVFVRESYLCLLEDAEVTRAATR
jgi:hypothetical protein